MLIDRKGHVQYVMVGDNRRIELPDFKRVRVATGRFRGLRCVHTHLRGEHLTQDDLADLALLRLDLMAAIDVDADTGLPGVVRAAHLLRRAAWGGTQAQIDEFAPHTCCHYTLENWKIQMLLSNMGSWLRRWPPSWILIFWI